ncbi:hypothetical protein GYMLUDRAFT_239609 [Collybiopsis luxurians FD-317 M1]|nr:hypothetical protein GYMLUDRAFT_239609 [Collybiopsis luxurians FD-317 M1]
MRWKSARYFLRKYRRQWILNIAVFIIGIASTVAGYRNNSVSVTVLGALATLGSLISSTLPSLTISSDLEAQTLMMTEFSMTTQSPASPHWNDSPFLESTPPVPSLILSPDPSEGSLTEDSDFGVPDTYYNEEWRASQEYIPLRLSSPYVDSVNLKANHSGSPLDSLIWGEDEDLIDFATVLSEGTPAILHSLEPEFNLVEDYDLLDASYFVA